MQIDILPIYPLEFVCFLAIVNTTGGALIALTALLCKFHMILNILYGAERNYNYNHITTNAIQICDNIELPIIN
jgi:hypothetical protein